MNSAFYESITRSTKKIFQYELFKKSAAPLLVPTKIPYTSSLVKNNLQPLNFNFNINTILRLAKSTKVKDSKISEAIFSNFLDLGNYYTNGKNAPKNYLDVSSAELFKNTTSVSGSLFEDSSRFFKRKEGICSPLVIRPIYLSDSSISCIKSGKLKLLVLRHEIGSNEIVSKPKPHNNFMVRKQKRYTRRKNIESSEYSLGTKAMEYYNLKLKQDVKSKPKGKILLNRDNSLNYVQSDLTSRYKFFMKNKLRGDDTSIVNSRRMIRTKRTLVLPAHVNLTAITNSYDVIHSWFIPGLGLKMDCIPGRSTHHTFYIDNVGFYYGQCAEVCGRYHHHMPIRICALPFNHFLLWWHHFGVPKLLPNSTSKKVDISSGLRKYVW